MKKKVFDQLVASIKEAGKTKREKQIKSQKTKQKQIAVPVVVDLMPDLRYSLRGFDDKKIEICSDVCKFLNEDWLEEKFVGWTCRIFGDIEGYEGHNYSPLRHKKCKFAEKKLKRCNEK